MLKQLEHEMTRIVIDAKNMHYTPLNKLIRQATHEGATEIILENIMGQRFIGDGLTGDVKITINGVPGGDLGMFMKGPTIEVLVMLIMHRQIPWMMEILSFMVQAETQPHIV